VAQSLAALAEVAVLAALALGAVLTVLLGLPALAESE
jgi:hypothetical protein